MTFWFRNVLFLVDFFFLFLLNVEPFVMDGIVALYVQFKKQRRKNNCIRCVSSKCEHVK